MKTLKRIWKNYNKWEDWKSGFYSPKRNISEDLVKNIENFLVSENFYYICIKLFSEWKNCMDHNMSFSGSNRRSYLGQAACCFLFGVSAKTTSDIFTKMSDENKREANRIADLAIDLYEKVYYKEPI